MPPPPASKKAKGLGKILGKRLPGTTALIGLSPQEKIQQELDCYLGNPILEMEEDPLIWWRVEHQRYPHLAKLAQKYLCLCAISVPSERIFSIAGQIVSDRRSALKECYYCMSILHHLKQVPSKCKVVGVTPYTHPTHTAFAPTRSSTTL